MKAARTVLQEQLQHSYLIYRLSAYELKQAHAGNLLGIVWLFLNPLMQIALYWVVFGLGIRGGAPVQGVPYFVWMMCGLVPWFYISTSIPQGSNAIYSRLGIVSKMNFPLSIIPIYTVISQLYTHVILVVVLLLIASFSVGISFIGVIGLLYGIVSTTSILLVLALVTSTLSTIVRDVHLMIQSVSRMLFFITPITWVPGVGMKKLYLLLLKINPFYYVVEIYRQSLLKGNLSFLLSSYTIYFWIVVLLLFSIGSLLHVRFRKQFVDYL